MSYIAEKSFFSDSLWTLVKAKFPTPLKAKFLVLFESDKFWVDDVFEAHLQSWKGPSEQKAKITWCRHQSDRTLTGGLVGDTRLLSLATSPGTLSPSSSMHNSSVSSRPLKAAPVTIKRTSSLHRLVGCLVPSSWRLWTLSRLGLWRGLEPNTQAFPRLSPRFLRESFLSFLSKVRRVFVSVWLL